MKVMYEKAMRNNADADLFVGQQSQILPGPMNHGYRLKQGSLQHSKTMQAAILLLRLYTPLCQAIGNLWCQVVKLAFKPLGSNLSHPTVEVGTYAVKIDPNDSVLDAHESTSVAALSPRQRLRTGEKVKQHVSAHIKPPKVSGMDGTARAAAIDEGALLPVMAR
jgi:hypothetical protein